MIFKEIQIFVNLGIYYVCIILGAIRSASNPTAIREILVCFPFMKSFHVGNNNIIAVNSDINIMTLDSINTDNIILIYNIKTLLEYNYNLTGLLRSKREFVYGALKLGFSNSKK